MNLLLIGWKMPKVNTDDHMLCQNLEQDSYKYIFSLKAKQLFSHRMKWFTEHIFCFMEDFNIGINVRRPYLSQN